VHGRAKAAPRGLAIVANQLMLSVGVETRTRIGGRPIGVGSPPNAEAYGLLRSRLGGRANSASYAGRAVPCPERKLKSATTCFRAGFYLPAAGPMPVTAVESQISKATIMTIERPMFPPREIETYEPFSIPDAFCDALVRIERIGSCRRLVFAVSETNACPGGPARAIVAKLIVPAELMADIAQMIAADRPEPGAVFARIPLNAVAN
jgi:hypothetical protein